MCVLKKSMGTRRNQTYNIAYDIDVPLYNSDSTKFQNIVGKNMWGVLVQVTKNTSITKCGWL